MRVGFLTAGGVEDGLGHVYESLTVADELRGKAELFYRGADPVADLIELRGYPSTRITNVSAGIEQLRERRLDAVVVDLPDPSEETLAGVADLDVQNVVVFGNPGINLPRNTSKWADVLVDYTTGLGSGHSSISVERGARIFSGPAFFVLRPEFRNASAPKPSDPPERLLALFGGADPSGLTVRALERLGSQWKRIIAVVGPANERGDRVRSLAAERDETEVLANVGDVAETMGSVDVVLTSPGATTFEALSLGLPTLAFYQNNHQRTAYESIWFAYSSTDIERIEGLIDGLNRRRYSAYRGLVGRKFDKVLEAIENN